MVDALSNERAAMRFRVLVAVATTDNVGRVTDALRDTGVSYEVT